METKRAGWLVTLLGIGGGLVLLLGSERDASSVAWMRGSEPASGARRGPGLDEARASPAGETPPSLVAREPILAKPVAPSKLAVLEVACRSAYGDEGTPVAGVELAAGVLRSAKEGPAEEVTLARGESDGVGRVRFELALPEENAPSAATVLFARVVEEGFQERESTHTLQRAIPGVDPLVVVAARGGTARGLVRAAAGKPAPRAELVLLEEEPSGSGHHAHRMSGVAKADGRFELHVSRSGHYSVQARASGLGSGCRRDVGLDVARLPQDLRITIDGEGVLEGLLADPQGAPIKETRLKAVPADLGRTPTYAERYDRELEPGLCCDSTRTDLAGRFRFTGLRPGDYVLTQGEGTVEKPIGGPFSTGLEALAIVPAPRLEIRVLQEDGSPVVLAKKM